MTWRISSRRKWRLLHIVRRGDVTDGVQKSGAVHDGVTHNRAMHVGASGAKSKSPPVHAGRSVGHGGRYANYFGRRCWKKKSQELLAKRRRGTIISGAWQWHYPAESAWS